jgi:diaminohydroxyphosphoribosylaminopyrimidine deaminase/5-amino-6-(5-phosphoribosylamino)uracil reductase
MNEAFVHFMRTGLPLVTLKSALTLDGKIAAPQDNSGWITSAEARKHVQVLRHGSDAILTGIGTLLADDCLLTDRSGEPRSRPLLRIVVDSQLRIPVNSRMVSSADGDLAVVTTSAAPDERRRALESRGVRVETFDGPGGRTDFQSVVQWLAQEKYQSLMIEAGSKVNWAALESGVVDRIFFYYAPKILGGLQSLPVAGGAGRQTRVDAIRFENVALHKITEDEFAVEAWLIKQPQGRTDLD